MSETMTLEELVAYCGTSPSHARVRAAALAAIRERDELRSALSEMRELARDYERDRDKAEAELAALKERIAEAPRMIVVLLPYTIELRSDHSANDAARTSILDGKRVRLVVEE